MHEPTPSTAHARPAPRRPWIVGVLGGIGAGKSAVSRLLAGREGVVIDADALAHEVLDEPQTRAFLRASFGPEVLDASGRADRARLAERVFRSPEERARLEAFTHPRVRARIRAALEDARAAERPRIVLDVPLLLENEAAHGLVAHCDLLVFVEADEADRRRRVRETRGWTPDELARREAAQLSLDAKRARADRVLVNRGTIRDLEGEVNRLLAEQGVVSPTAGGGTS